MGSDDGIRVYIDDVLFHQAWRVKPFSTAAKDYNVTEEAEHTVRVEYFDGGGAGRVLVHFVKI